MMCRLVHEAKDVLPNATRTSNHSHNKKIYENTSIPKSESFKKSIVYQRPYIWNQLAETLK